MLPSLPAVLRFVTSLCFVLFVGVATAPQVQAQGAGYWHTSGNTILDANGAQVRITAINWYGFETTRAVAGGLTSQDYKSVLDTIKKLGYNTVRIPLSNQVVESPGYPGAINFSNGMNSDLSGLDSLHILDKIVSYSATLGLKIILDNHRSEAGDSAEDNGLWFTGSYPESAWINDWTTLANRYAGNPTVVGFDLRNEPHNAGSGGACWDCGGANDWHLAAQRAGNAVLGVNPKLLIFVEGVDVYGGDYYWWGGNLQGVSKNPVVLAVANQLVYSAHDYGPSVYGQPWFNASTTAGSLNAVWTNHWGFIAKNNIAPLWLGEFGTPNDAASVQNSQPGSQGQWFQSMIGYLAADPNLSWSYWALNGEDSLGLLDSQYSPTPVNAQKQSMLASIQFTLNPGGGTTTPTPAAPTALTATATSTSQVNLSWKASQTSGVTYTVYYGTSSGAITSVAASGLTATSYTANSLSAATTYYFAVTAVNSVGNSPASNTASATTQAAAAPAAPSGLTATATSSSQINLAWTASSTAGVTYSVYSGLASGSSTRLLASGLSGTTYPATGLTASTTYYFTIKAMSSGGTSSPASNESRAATQAGTAGSCHIAYLDQNDWGSGFTGNLSITTGTAVSSWKVTWSYAGNQLINQSWNSNYTQSGKAVTLTNASWNGSIAAGATLTGIGWNAGYSGQNANPVSFTLNGVPCQ